MSFRAASKSDCGDGCAAPPRAIPNMALTSACKRASNKAQALRGQANCPGPCAGAPSSEQRLARAPSVATRARGLSTPAPALGQPTPVHAARSRAPPATPPAAGEARSAPARPWEAGCPNPSPSASWQTTRPARAPGRWASRRTWCAGRRTDWCRSGPDACTTGPPCDRKVGSRIQRWRGPMSPARACPACAPLERDSSHLGALGELLEPLCCDLLALGL